MESFRLTFSGQQEATQWCHAERSEKSHIFSFQVKRLKEEILQLTASG